MAVARGALHVGDRVTVATRRGITRSVVDRTAVLSLAFTVTGMTGICFATDEGVVWVRGHAPRSVVRALEAAYALQSAT